MITMTDNEKREQRNAYARAYHKKRMEQDPSYAEHRRKLYREWARENKRKTLEKIAELQARIAELEALQDNQ